MKTSGRLLLCGLCVFLSCCTVRGIRYLPPEAANFPKCDPSLDECPANASCEETIEGFHCACDHNFFNVKEKMSITYPGGECLDKCRNNSDCPSEATCTAGRCYCKICKPQGNSCITLVKMDDVCPDPSTTTNPLLK